MKALHFCSRRIRTNRALEGKKALNKHASPCNNAEITIRKAAFRLFFEDKYALQQPSENQKQNQK